MRRGRTPPETNGRTGGGGQRSAAIAVGAAVAALALTACGAAEHHARPVDVAALDRAGLRSVADEPASHRVDLTVRQGSYAFVQGAARAAAGRISITLHNRTGVWHNILVLDLSKPGPAGPPSFGHAPVLPSTGTQRDGSATTVVDLRPGSYRIICAVLGHAMNGMSIPLQVVADPGATDAPLPSTAHATFDGHQPNAVTLTRASAAPAFDRQQVTVRHGRATFKLVNRSPVPTDLVVASPAGDPLVPDGPLIAGDRLGFSIDLVRGEYLLLDLLDPTHLAIPLHVR